VIHLLQKIGPGETRMNRSSSHPSHENRQIIISTVWIRRGGAPSGAAAFIIFGGIRVSPPPVIPEEADLTGKCPQNFSSCVPVAAGIVSVFMENPLQYSRRLSRFEQGTIYSDLTEGFNRAIKSQNQNVKGSGQGSPEQNNLCRKYLHKRGTVFLLQKLEKYVTLLARLLSQGYGSLAQVCQHTWEPKPLSQLCTF
jgi:hypothetical protein